MLIGIMLVYYPNYFEKSYNEFLSVLKSIDHNYKLYVVINNNEVLPLLGDIMESNVLEGDNSNWEFSGWDSALKKINVCDSDTVVFSNDTFCQHNPWNDRIKKQFSTKFRKIHESNHNSNLEAFSGTLDSFRQYFSINNYINYFWVSSYLFLITGAALKKIGHLSLDEILLSEMVFLKENKIEFSSLISDNLKKHIMNWIFPVESKKGWYNKSNDVAMKLRKIKTILNEKYLSSYLVNNGVIFYEVKPIKSLKKELGKFLFKKLKDDRNESER